MVNKCSKRGILTLAVAETDQQGKDNLVCSRTMLEVTVLAMRMPFFWTTGTYCRAGLCHRLSVCRRLSVVYRLPVSDVRVLWPNAATDQDAVCHSDSRGKGNTAKREGGNISPPLRGS